MLAVDLHVFPTFRFLAVMEGVVPAFDRNLAGIVGTKWKATVPCVCVPAGRESASNPTNCNHRTCRLEVGVIHESLPLPRDVRVPHRVLRLIVFDLLQAIPHPGVKLLGLRGAPAALAVLLQRSSHQQKATRCEHLALAIRHESGTEDIRSQHDYRAGLHLHIVSLSLKLPVGLQLQGATIRADDCEDHDLVPREYCEPFCNLLLYIRSAIVSVASRGVRVQDGGGAVRKVKAQVIHISR
mmetsp:Transcript_126855/g.224818  ORF Transcript_126855/g.224818 Transcript_126855/m.224818 type:complete len:240 (+) Transcript_126855:1798-2517(+)